MDVRLPNLGEGAESGTVVSVLVKEGDRLTSGQTILELENEKAVAPVPAPAQGVVSQIRVKEGDRLSVGQVILTLEESEDQAPLDTGKSKQATAKEPAEEEAPGQTQAEVGEEEPQDKEETPSTSVAPPSIRRLARDLGIDLRRIKGTERGGRIVMADVRAYIKRLQAPGEPRQAAAQAERAPAAAKPAIDFAKWGPIDRKLTSPLRQTIGRRMSENWLTIPHVTQFAEADVSGLLELGKRHAAAYEKQGAKLTLTSFALKAAVMALVKHPIFNSSLDESKREIVLKKYFHVGLAVDTEHGLLVPVLRDVDKKSLLELSREVADLADKARQRKLSGEEMQGGTFTISNQGGIGGGAFTPIVNHPEVAILGMGRGVPRPVAVDGQVMIRSMLPLAVSYDHRVIDGGAAARFVTDLVAALTGFTEELVKL